VTLRSGANNIAIMEWTECERTVESQGPVCVRRTTNPTCSLQEDDWNVSRNRGSMARRFRDCFFSSVTVLFWTHSFVRAYGTLETLALTTVMHKRSVRTAQ